MDQSSGVITMSSDSREGLDKKVNDWICKTNEKFKPENRGLSIVSYHPTERHIRKSVCMTPYTVSTYTAVLAYNIVPLDV